MSFQHFFAAVLFGWGAWHASVQAETVAAPVKAVASFSILGDWVRQVGGDRVTVDVLVAPGGDAHVFQPKPVQARQLGQAHIVFSNGLGFEGWMGRLLKAAGFKGRHIVTSTGVATLRGAADPAHAAHHHDATDPHAWQNVNNALVYVRNIAQGLCDVDPAGCAGYRRRADAYSEQLRGLEQDIRTSWQAIAPAQRLVITSHDAFAYYAQAYGVRFLAPQGVSTESEASAQGVARLIRQIKNAGARALFVESIADPRLIEQIARETGLRPSSVGLYSDSLAPAGAAADSYLGMMRHNTRHLLSAIQSQP